MNPGMKQGFIRFNTTPCEILKFLHSFGPARHRDIVELMELEPRVVGMSLHRLLVHGFIYELGKISILETGERSQMLYGLHKPRRKLKYRPLTTAERTVRYRAYLKLRAPSVFDWRGPQNADIEHNCRRLRQKT